MLRALKDKIRSLFGAADSGDIPPPGTPVVERRRAHRDDQGATRVRPAAPRPRQAVDGVDFEPRAQTRAGAPLRGRVVSPDGNTNVLIDNEDRTEELLKLSEDDLELAEDDGFDPYNTGSFKPSNVWKDKR